MLPNLEIACAGSACVKTAVEAYERAISKDNFCSPTLQDGRQLPLIHVPHLLKATEILKSLNQYMSVF
jgi:hypothetical protein